MKPLVPIGKVRLIEAISKNDAGQEAVVNSEIMKMAGMEYEVKEINGPDAPEAFLRALFTGMPRYIHISAHGDGDSLDIGQGEITAADIQEHQGSLKHQLITISACSRLSGCLVGAFLEKGASAVLSPTAEIDFDEAALFTALFYFGLSKCPKLSDNSRRGEPASTLTSARISQFIDTFQRAKQAYLGLGGTGAHCLEYSFGSERRYIY